MSSLDNVKHAMGWRHPNDRQGCLHCRYCEVSDTLRFGRPELICRKGGFFTHRHALCGDYEPREFEGAAQ